MRSYAIGDIHGHPELLHAAHARIAADRAAVGDAEAPVVHVGDLTDRGPDSRAVLDHLVRGIDAGKPWLVLKGNHDRMFAHFLDDPAWHDPMLRADLDWLNPRLGGNTTLASYGVPDADTRPLAEVHAEALAHVPAAHRAFLAALPDRLRLGEILYVHAGIRPGVPIADQTEDDLTWIRAPFHNDMRDHGVLIIHGHTPVKRATHYGNRVNIDTGAAYGGPLTAVVAEGRDVWEVTDRGRVPLVPVGPAPRS